MKKVIVVLFGLFFYYLASYNFSYKKIDIEPDVDVLLQKKVTKNYLENSISDALSMDRYEDARDFLSLAEYLHIPISNRLKKEVENSKTLYHDIEEFSKGFLSGKSDTKVALYGSITSDFTVVGDLRDLTKEGEKYIQDKPYDEFLLGISAIGVGLTFSTIATAGGSIPLKIGVSVLKAGVKTKRVTKSFSKYLLQKLSKSYDKRVFKSVNFTDPKSISRALKTIDITPLKAPLKNLSKIENSTSLYDTLYLLKFIDDEKDLTRVAKLSQKYGKNTKPVFKILGKSAIRGSKTILKYSAKFILASLLFLLSIGYLLKLFITSKSESI